VLLNGRVYTVDDALPRAEAFAVKNGRFVAVGSSDDVRNLMNRASVQRHSAANNSPPFTGRTHAEFLS
jgi:predicted amidohydrolase YtcJ